MKARKTNKFFERDRWNNTWLDDQLDQEVTLIKFDVRYGRVITFFNNDYGSLWWDYLHGFETLDGKEFDHNLFKLLL